MAIDGPFRSLEIPRCAHCGYKLSIESSTINSCPRCGAILDSSSKNKKNDVVAKENEDKVIESGAELASGMENLIRISGIEPNSRIDEMTAVQHTAVTLETKAIAEQFKIFKKKMSRYFKEKKPDKKEALREELLTVSKVIQEMILKLEKLTQDHSEFKETYARVKSLEQDLAKFLSILNLA